MNLKIGKFTVTSDKNNIIVDKVGVRRTDGSKGQVHWKAGDSFTQRCGYHGTIESAVKRILLEKIKESDAQDIKTLLAELERFTAEITKAVKPEPPNFDSLIG